MNRKFIIPLFILIVVMLIALGVWLGTVLNRQTTVALSPYSAVYLATGDLYFGEFSWSNRPRLRNGWVLERTVDATNQSRLSLSPLSGVFWGPVHEMELNPEHIVYWARLAAGSQLAQALANPAAFRQTGEPIPLQGLGIPNTQELEEETGGEPRLP